MSAAQEVIKSCFQDIVSIKGGCGDIASTSGLYANQVDITPDFIGEIITKNYKDAKDFFDQKKEFVISNVVEEVITACSFKLRTPTLLNEFRVGQFQDNLKMVAGDGALKGINIDLCNSESYLNVFVNEISLQLDYTGNVDVLVYDLMQDKLLDTITIACVAGEVSTVYPSKEYYSAKRKLNLAFVYDSTGIGANTTYLTGSGCSTCGTINSTVSNSVASFNAVKIDAGAQKIKSNLKTSGETGGMSIVHSVQCNRYAWLCQFSNMLALPILYRLGEEIMNFAINISPNDRVNTTTTLNKEELENRRAFYASKYTQALNNLISNIKTPDDSRCFECKEAIRHTISTL